MYGRRKLVFQDHVPVVANAIRNDRLWEVTLISHPFQAELYFPVSRTRFLHRPARGRALKSFRQFPSPNTRAFPNPDNNASESKPAVASPSVVVQCDGERLNLTSVSTTGTISVHPSHRLVNQSSRS
ncbi:hypothetical protein EVAR_45991_1 [Eumeta japonica]|uniref:Uncharacterized protein n=1 Tax=Eumeta variegata TaxID=151549 RepID=A0A4C1X8X4_EUMVA|nr:hypothetical protein EVAR_45991_1 [Eumeta japonica]